MSSAESALGIRFESSGWIFAIAKLGTTGALSGFLLHILSAFGELEREMIRERVRAGLRAAKAKGRVLGRPRRAFRRDEAVQLRSPAYIYCNQRLPFQKQTGALAAPPAGIDQIATPELPVVKGAVHRPFL